MMRKFGPKGYYEELRDIFLEYKSVSQDSVIDPNAVMRWAIANNKYSRPPKTMLKQASEDLRKALSQERYIDKQGRTVRKYHVAIYEVDGEQLPLYADILEAQPDHMRVSLQQRRQGIFADVKRHKDDVDSYNDNNKFNVQIPLFSYNFELDLEEVEMPSEYDEDNIDVDLDSEIGIDKLKN
jgi:hypothetical protein